MTDKRDKCAGISMIKLNQRNLEKGRDKEGKEERKQNMIKKHEVEEQRQRVIIIFYRDKSGF